MTTNTEIRRTPANPFPRKTNICMLCPNSLDVTSFYRGVGPMAHFARVARTDVELSFANSFDWNTVALTDMLFIQRPYKGMHTRFIRDFKDSNRPVWVDYDDWLLQVPNDNPSYWNYNKAEHQQGIIDAVMLADVVTVSTEYLAKLIRGIIEQANKSPKLKNKEPLEKVVVVRNALNEDLWMAPNRANKPGEGAPSRTLIWRGTETHARDLFNHGNAWLRIAEDKRFSAWKFEFYGYNPFFISDLLAEEKASVAEPIGMHDLLKFLLKRRPEILVHPLHGSHFNMAKSNIAYLEATFVGALAIGPEWEEWKRPGCFTYKDEADLHELFIEVMSMSDEQRQEQVRLAQEHCFRYETLEARVHLRSKIVDDLIRKRLGEK